MDELTPQTESAPAQATSSERPRLPGFVRWFVIPLASLFLIVLFVIVQFPFDRFRHALAHELSQSLGAQVQVGALDAELGWRGVQFRADDVNIRFPDAQRVEIATATLAPAPSLAWFGGSPTVHVTAQGPLGQLAGNLTLGDAPAWDGKLQALALDSLPTAEWLSGAVLKGSADLHATVQVQDVPSGDATFEARDGTVFHPELPVEVPYDSLRGVLHFGGENLVEIRNLELEGPMLGAQVSGKAGQARRPELAPLDIQAHVEVTDPNLRPMLQQMGINLAPDGSLDVKLGGTLSNPRFR